MSSLGSPNPLLFGAAKDYEIERSLRFNSADDAYIGFTPSSTGSQKVWTWSGWVKRTKMGVYTNLMTGPNHSGEHNNGVVQLAISNADQLYTYFDTDGSNPYGALHDAKFRDPSAWYHIVWKVDAANTEQRIWVNGVEYTTASGQNPPDYAYAMNKSGHQMTMGATAWDGVSGHSDLYLAEVHYCDGQEYQASDFGETDEDTGQWIPKEVSGITYGTNGCYLDFSDNSNTTAATLGKDSSGNSNNWTPNNFSVAAGTGNDSVVDTPTNNYCVLNGVEVNGNESAGTLTQGGLEFTADNNYAVCPGTFSLKNGKYYWEVTYQAGVQIYGIYRGNAMGENAYVSYDPNGNCPGLGIQANNGTTYGSTGDGSTAGGSQGTSINSLTTNDVMAFASDIPNGTLKVYKNDTLEHTFTGFNSHDWFPAVSGYAGQVCQVNFGSNGFKYTPPTGYVALCTANLPEPTIKKPDEHFVIKTYNGTGSTQTITTGLDADFVWVKRRDSSNYNILANTISGASYYLVSNEPDSESGGGTQLINGLSSTGFQVGTENAVNNSSGTYVSWNWKESATAGFDIVGYTGTGADLNVSHGLGVAPDLLIIKGRETDNDWAVLSKDNDDGDFLQLNSSAAESGAGSIFGSTFTRPTSSVFTVGNTGETGTNNKDYLAYCFSSVEGYSKVGIYKGNANANGTFVWTGFRPAFVMTKGLWGSNWNVYDIKRNPYNVANDTLYPNLENAESAESESGNQMDFLSNGFKLRGSDNDTNKTSGSGTDGKFIYIAFAETSFKYANAR